MVDPGFDLVGVVSVLCEGTDGSGVDAPEAVGISGDGGPDVHGSIIAVKMIKKTLARGE
jgi:hypothetical protein